LFLLLILGLRHSFRAGLSLKVDLKKEVKELISYIKVGLIVDYRLLRFPSRALLRAIKGVSALVEASIVL
jgi:hypothetical protein